MSDAIITSRSNAEYSIESWEAVSSEMEHWLSSCETVAGILASLPDEAQPDFLELLQVMGRSREELESGRETIREMLTPLSGVLVLATSPGDARHSAVQKWSSAVGCKVRELRKSAEMTQLELAEKARLPQSHISRIENGEISPTRLTIEKIAEALGQPIGVLDPSAT